MVIWSKIHRIIEHIFVYNELVVIFFVLGKFTPYIFLINIKAFYTFYFKLYCLYCFCLIYKRSFYKFWSFQVIIIKGIVSCVSNFVMSSCRKFLLNEKIEMIEQLEIGEKNHVIANEFGKKFLKMQQFQQHGNSGYIENYILNHPTSSHCTVQGP